MKKLYNSRFFTLYLILLCASGIRASDRITEGLVAFFPFTEGSGIYALDQSGVGEPLLIKFYQNQAVEWIEGGGIRILQPALMKSLQGTAKISQACTASQAISLEIWIRPAAASQSGPARIMTASFGTSHRNWMLGQDGSKFIGRLRTTVSGVNGTPDLSSPSGSSSNALQHVVFVHEPNGAEKMFINGNLVASGNRSGNFSNWIDSFELSFGNEIGADRPWLGDIHLAAVYSQPLSANEVITNFQAGLPQSGSTFSDQSCATPSCMVDGFGTTQRITWIIDVPFSGTNEYRFVNGGHFDLLPDGRAHLYGQTQHLTNSNYGWFIDVWLTGKMNWAQWSALGRSWKGSPAVVGNNYLNWDFYILDPDAENVMIGLGAFEDDVLHLTHRPSNYYYGFQMGVAANDQNALPGMSVWFDYSGTINGQSVSDQGDFNMEGECVTVPVMECLDNLSIDCEEDTSPANTGTPVVFCDGDYELTYADVFTGPGCNQVIQRTWTATSAAGDVAECTQSIALADTTPPVIQALPAIVASCEALDEFAQQVADNCDPAPEVEVTYTGVEWVSPQPCAPGMYRTQTMGGWGANPNGNNPGTYLVAHFDEVFPTGLTIGCNNTLTLTSAQAVIDFLPSGSSPTVLPAGQMTNPGGSYANNFAGQLVAATLSVMFDAANENFGTAFPDLGALTIEDGTLAGMSVYTLLEEANAIIGGCPSAYSFSAIHGALGSLNQNFVDGTMNGGFLDCTMGMDCYLSAEVMITATDACGNSSELTQTINLGDGDLPAFEGLIEELYVECGQVPVPQDDFGDSCISELLDFTVEETHYSGACQPTIERVYTATGPCGQVSSFTQYIFVQDTQAPVFLNQPQDISGVCGDAIPEYSPIVGDQCDTDIQVVFDQNEVVVGCTRSITRTWTATDDCGNSSMADQVITITDNTGPVASGFEPVVYVSCGEGPSADLVTFSDACGAVTDVTLSIQVQGESCDRVITRTWTATDECGNQTVLVQQIIISDTTPPVIDGIPAALDLPCGSELPAFNPLAADNCSEVTVTYSETELPESGSCRQIARTWAAEDACGNQSSVVQLVTFTDSVPPVLNNVPADYSASCGAVPGWANVTASDNCEGSMTVIPSEEMVLTPCGLIYTRSWMATDACGNTSSASQVITLADSEAPVFTAQEEINLACHQLASYTIAVTDDCTGQPSVLFDDQVSGTGCQTDITRTWTATDQCGNASTFVQLIHVTDEQGPAFVSVPPSYGISCMQTPLFEEPLVFDQCGGGVELTLNETMVGSACQQLITRVWTATDECGNSSTAQQVITIADNTAPVILNVPANVSLSCNNASNIPAVAEVTATDNCDTTTEVIFNEDVIPGDCPGELMIVRTWTATDNCGNTSEVSQVIAITDTTAPVFDSVPEDVLAQCDDIPAPPVMTATDNCSAEVTITFSQQNLTGGCPVIQRTWTATDACGNTALVMQFVELTDDEPPLLQGIPPGGPVSCNNIPPVPDPYAVDNCDDIVDVSMSETIIGQGCEFLLIRTFIAEDDCGNATVVSQTFQVSDEAAPVFVNPQPNVTLQCTQLPTYQGPAVFDDCGNTVQLTYTQQITGSGCQYTIHRTYTATDLCGNSASYTQNLLIIDTTAPVLSGVPASTTVGCGNIPAPAQPVATDGCSGNVPVQFSQQQIGAGCGIQIIRTWTATDACGNTATAIQMILVFDLVAPVLSGVPVNQTLNCGQAVPPPAAVTAADNCTISGFNPVVQFAQTTTNTPCGQVITRTWTATDACGNTVTATRTLTISDQTAPVFTNAPVNLSVACNAVPAAPAVNATDNCASNVTITFSEGWITGICPFQIVRTWTASDPCGNTATHQQIITVTDNEAPVLPEAPADVTVTCDQIPVVTHLEANDNCAGTFYAFMVQTVMPGECAYQIVRTWTAEDNCGNTTVRQQIITVIDEEAPVFLAVPQNLTVQCGEEPAVFVPEVTDCNEAIVTFEEMPVYTNCPGEYQLLHTWTATDPCGNVSVVSRTVTFEDNSAPVLSSLPQNISVECDDVPPVPAITSTDACEGETEVVFTEEESAYTETNGACVLTDATNFFSQVAVWLPNIPGLNQNWVFGSDPGILSRDEAAGTAEVFATVYNVDNPDFGWQVHLILANERNWSQWSGLGRSYKNDLNLAGSNYLDWSYFELQPGSTLTGIGSLSGSSLALTHAPWHYYYGFQLGVAANNRNANHGLSGWFNYTGTINGESRTGVGDLFVDVNCCEPRTIVRTWTAQDCAGNVTIHSQEIQVGPVTAPFAFNVSDRRSADWFDVTGSTDEFFTLRYELFLSGQVDIMLYDSIGRLISNVFSGSASGQTEYLWRCPKQDLAPGTYVFTLCQGQLMLSDREIVMH